VLAIAARRDRGREDQRPDAHKTVILVSNEHRKERGSTSFAATGSRQRPSGVVKARKSCPFRSTATGEPWLARKRLSGADKYPSVKTVRTSIAM